MISNNNDGNMTHHHSTTKVITLPDKQDDKSSIITFTSSFLVNSSFAGNFLRCVCVPSEDSNIDNIGIINIFQNIRIMCVPKRWSWLGGIRPTVGAFSNCHCHFGRCAIFVTWFVVSSQCKFLYASSFMGRTLDWTIGRESGKEERLERTRWSMVVNWKILYWQNF